jgi:UDP-N-acetylmuramate dehydrogenase
MSDLVPEAALEALDKAFAGRIQRNASMTGFTAARIGGTADVLITASSADELAETVNTLWDWEVPFRVLGSGSNVLISDQGIREAIVLNRARGIRFDVGGDDPVVEAESGAMLGSIARRAAEKGLSGLEWAVNIPGTLGGAVVGNAGAFDGDIAGNLQVAEILQQGIGVQQWSADQLEFGYRESWMKHHPGVAVVLKVILRLSTSTPEETQAKMKAIVSQRQQTQPAGASIGSMFKNPEGDFAGRLIDAAGLKGTKNGGAQISPMHANFFINLGGASAADVLELIRIARTKVREMFDIELDLEIELIGDWERTNVVNTH